jgi:hypothetical protein
MSGRKKGVSPLSNITITMSKLPDIDYDQYDRLKEARAQAFELCEHLEGCIEEGHARLHQARMGFDDMETVETYLREQTDDYEDAEEEYHDIVFQQEEWYNKFRGVHVNWVWTQEAAGNPIHKMTLLHGPPHPSSYLLYDDGGNLIFQRDDQGRYSSYTFWIENITHPNPIETLGKDYYSSRELRVLPSLIEELFTLETEYLKKGTGDLAHIQKIRSILKAGYDLYKIEKPGVSIRPSTNELVTT